MYCCYQVFRFNFNDDSRVICSLLAPLSCHGIDTLLCCFQLVWLFEKCSVYLNSTPNLNFEFIGVSSCSV